MDCRSDVMHLSVVLLVLLYTACKLIKSFSNQLGASAAIQTKTLVTEAIKSLDRRRQTNNPCNPTQPDKATTGTNSAPEEKSPGNTPSPILAPKRPLLEVDPIPGALCKKLACHLKTCLCRPLHPTDNSSTTRLKAVTIRDGVREVNHDGHLDVVGIGTVRAPIEIAPALQHATA